MLNHYLLTLYRSLTRHRLYATLNVAGLAVGIAVFLVLMLDVRFETSFDRWIPDSANLYRLTGAYTFPGQAPDVSAVTPTALLPLLQANYPQIMSGARLVYGTGQPVTNGAALENEQVNYVDASFLKVLALPLSEGDRRTALADPESIVVTKALASKYFGRTHGRGQPLTIYHDGKPHLYRVSAVLEDVPKNSHLSLGILVPLTPALEKALGFGDGLGASSYTYLRFRDQAGRRAVAADLPRLLARQPHASGPPTVALSLTPLAAIHFADANLRWTMKPGVDAALVYSLGVVGVLTLLISALNYVNLATARSALRSREIAIRKVMGASRAGLVTQLLAESIAVALIAGLIGLALMELSLPMINALSGSSLVVSYWGRQSILPGLLGLVLLVGIGAGIYPALLLSRFEAASVLAATRSPGGGKMEARVRAALTGGQFTAAAVFIICTLVVASQAQFLRSADRGFRREGLILVDSLQADQALLRQGAILAAFRKLPGVVSATESISEPGLPNEKLLPNVRVAGVDASENTLEGDIIGDDYLQTYGVNLLAGRMFDPHHALDDISGLDRPAFQDLPSGYNIIINERASKTLGFATPAEAVGRNLLVHGALAPIIGVIGNIHFGSPKKPAASIIYQYSSGRIYSATGAVRFVGVAPASMIVRLQAAWRRLAPEVPFEAKTAEAGLSDFYLPDEQRARLFTLGTTLAVLLSCVGLYGLASFNSARRVREIGIRKTLGASTGDILRLLVGQFLRPVLLANLVAWPLAWLAMRSWLAGFDQRIALGPAYFLGATALTLIIALSTVTGEALAAARAEPAKALRHD